MAKKFIEKVGFSSWGGRSYNTYLVLGRLWVHIARDGRFGISFKPLPF